MALNGVLRPDMWSCACSRWSPPSSTTAMFSGWWRPVRTIGAVCISRPWDEHDHHSLWLREATSGAWTTWAGKVDSAATLKKLAADVEASGLCGDTAWIAAGEHLETGERFRFTVPTGHVMELFADKGKVGNNCGTDGPDVNPDPWPGRAERHRTVAVRPLVCCTVTTSTGRSSLH